MGGLEESLLEAAGLKKEDILLPTAFSGMLD